MLCLMNLYPKPNKAGKEQPQSDKSNSMGKLNIPAEKKYDAALKSMVMDCLEPAPGDRPHVEDLWRRVHEAVTWFPPGQKSLPLKLQQLGDGEAILLRSDRYAVWAR